MDRQRAKKAKVPRIVGSWRLTKEAWRHLRDLAKDNKLRECEVIEKSLAHVKENRVVL